MTPARLSECDCHPWEVWLDPSEKAWARRVGEERHRRAVRRRSIDRAGKDERESHVFGAECELAFALLMRVEWPARIDTFRSLPDVDPDWEVRGSRGGHDLKVRDADVGSRWRYALMIHRRELDTYRWAGWLRGTEIAALTLRYERRRRDLAPALWVPGSRLHLPGDVVE